MSAPPTMTDDLCVFSKQGGQMDLLNLISGDIHTVVYRAGDSILREGEDSGYMYLIQAGIAEVLIHGKAVRTLHRGEIFGEMALIDGSPHSADVVAQSECTLIPIDERRFLFLVHENPIFALHVMRLMAHRLRSVPAHRSEV